ncbi:MAG: hypothetical protein CM1200mP16_14950 [Nitrospina sp.]|nr:MAG: hypothetical protein CM1200mP16_14950 [Nitrospina sp.]
MKNDQQILQTPTGSLVVELTKIPLCLWPQQTRGLEKMTLVVAKRRMKNKEIESLDPEGQDEAIKKKRRIYGSSHKLLFW